MSRVLLGILSRLVLGALAFTGTTCARCILPESPPDGSFAVVDSQGLEVQIETVEVASGIMTITYLDASGRAQYVKYRIEP